MKTNTQVNQKPGPDHPMGADSSPSAIKNYPTLTQSGKEERIWPFDEVDPEGPDNKSGGAQGDNSGPSAIKNYPSLTLPGTEERVWPFDEVDPEGPPSKVGGDLGANSAASSRKKNYPTTAATQPRKEERVGPFDELEPEVPQKETGTLGENSEQAVIKNYPRR